MNITIGLLNNLVNHQIKSIKPTVLFETLDGEYKTIEDKSLLYLQQQRIIQLEKILNVMKIKVELTDSSFVFSTVDGELTEKIKETKNVVCLEEYVSRRNKTK